MFWYRNGAVGVSWAWVYGFVARRSGACRFPLTVEGESGEFLSCLPTGVGDSGN